MRFRTIVADPPWPYPKGSVSRAQTKETGKVHWADRVRVGPGIHYKTMTLADICNLPVRRLAHINAHLYLWTTNKFMEEAFSVVRAWGFTFKTILTWGKIKEPDALWKRAALPEPSMAVGHYFRGATEHVLFAVRGRLTLRGDVKPTLLLRPRLPHSVKPTSFFSMVEEVSYPRRLELFARKPRPGWDVWGNEVDGIRLRRQHRIRLKS